MSTYIVLFGPPASAKGIVAQHLTKALGLTHVSTGDLLRQHIREQTNIGRVAKAYVDAGELVPDDLITQLVIESLQEPLSGAGAILDGWPRTTAQAKSLETVLGKLWKRTTLVLNIRVSEQTSAERSLNRWVCQGVVVHSYHHTFRPPLVPGVCDFDGTPLVQRTDDNEAAVRRRGHLYSALVGHLLEYFDSVKVLRQINGETTLDELLKEVDSVIAQWTTQSER